MFVAAVPDRTSATLVDILKKYVAPGTIIHSNCWKAYDCLEEEGYQHYTVNHSENFRPGDRNTYKLCGGYVAENEAWPTHAPVPECQGTPPARILSQLHVEREEL